MRKTTIVGMAACALALSCTMLACSPGAQGAEEADGSAKAPASVSSQRSGVLDDLETSDWEKRAIAGDTLGKRYDEMTAFAEEFAPTVVTLEDGTQIQRVPSMQWTWGQSAVEDSAYNTYFLNAENRGCRACHADGLEGALDNMVYKHVEITANLGTELTPMDCRVCHDGSDGYIPTVDDFGTLIHGIHSRDDFTGTCMSCHNATKDGNGMQLWDEVKYEVYQGIDLIENVQGTFSYQQDNTIDMYSMTWLAATPANTENLGRQMDNVPTDDATFSNWPIKVTGLVNNPIDATLAEIIERAPVSERIITEQCMVNPLGGELITNVKVKGVSVRWLLEQAGVKDGATAVMYVAYDGKSRGNLLSNLAKDDNYLVYEVNGERLTWDHGFPVKIFAPNVMAPTNIRWMTELQVVDTPEDEVAIFYNSTDMFGEVYNNPNAGILHFKEGQIIEAGKPYTFEGYAFGVDEQIVKVEFSLDRGATWTSFDTSDSDSSRWVYWNFDYTPEEVGAGVLSVRAVTESGMVSVAPDEILFNVR